MTTMVCIAGFGDNGTMFDPLSDTALADRLNLLPVNLPGFGAPPGDGDTSLNSLADFIDEEVRRTGATMILAHSVASIIASVAAGKSNSPIRHIFSLEGNLTAEDAYFSGMAADYESAEPFRTAFLTRLGKLAGDQPVIERYIKAVACADPVSLWQLGCDARRFSDEHEPGEILMESADVVYVYNPANLPETSLAWLRTHDLPDVRMENASHWASVDQPHQLSETLTAELVRKHCL